MVRRGHFDVIKRDGGDLYALCLPHICRNCGNIFNYSGTSSEILRLIQTTLSQNRQYILGKMATVDNILFF